LGLKYIKFRKYDEANNIRLNKEMIVIIRKVYIMIEDKIKNIKNDINVMSA
jgi:hypothetical protein